MAPIGSNPNVDYDSIVVGASPTSLFEAAAMAEAGKRVLVVDRSDKVGGAWSTLSFEDLGTVECGTHYLVDLPNVYPFMEELPGLVLTPLEPPPEYVLARSILGFRRVSFTRKWGSQVSPRLYRGEFSWRSLRNLISPYYRSAMGILSPTPRRKPFKYIVGGTPALVESLEHVVRLGNFDLKLNGKLDNVEIDTISSLVKCRINGDMVCSGELFVPGSAKLTHVLINGIDTQLPGEFIENVQVHFLVDGAKEKKMSFVQFSGSQFAEMASDLTEFYRPNTERPNSRLLSAYVPSDVPRTRSTVEAIIAELKEAGLLEEQARLVDFYWTLVELPQRSREELDKISNLGQGLIRTLYTHSFSMAVSHNAAKWQPAIQEITSSFEAESSNPLSNAEYGKA